MREIRTYGSMSGDGKRVTALIEALAYPERGQQQLLPVAYDTAPVLDSTADGRIGLGPQHPILDIADALNNRYERHGWCRPGRKLLPRRRSLLLEIKSHDCNVPPSVSRLK